MVSQIINLEYESVKRQLIKILRSFGVYQFSEEELDVAVKSLIRNKIGVRNESSPIDSD
jgi:hypothetical protein